LDRLHERLVLARSRVLITNDDGIEAEGLKLLVRIVRKLAVEVWIVAPETEQSAASQSITMRRPLQVHQRGTRRYSVDGTPTDCILLAAHKIMKDRPPDIVLSGINRGGNMGEDTVYSGTVAAAREAAMLGFRSAALSIVYRNGGTVRWATAEAWVPKVLAGLAGLEWPGGVVLNVNVPDVEADAVAGVRVAWPGRRKIGGDIREGTDPRGRPFFWIGHDREEDRQQDATDLHAVDGGYVAITPLALKLADDHAMSALSAVSSW